MNTKTKPAAHMGGKNQNTKQKEIVYFNKDLGTNIYFSNIFEKIYACLLYLRCVIYKI